MSRSLFRRRRSKSWAPPLFSDGLAGDNSRTACVAQRPGTWSGPGSPSKNVKGNELSLFRRRSRPRTLLPSEAPSIERRGGEESARFALQDPAREPCAICGEPRTQVALFFTGGLLVRLHAACEAVWKQERQA